MTKTFSVSLFNAGWMNEHTNKPVMQCHPCKDVTLPELYDYIHGEQARSATENIRAISDKDEQNRLKQTTLSYCTPYGTFSYRRNDKLIERSGMMVIDIDDINDDDELAQLKSVLPQDRRYETLLLFTSPRGHGLKWFISVDVEPEDLAAKFREVSMYAQFEYGVVIDESGKDPARCCFLSYDPDCYINSKYREYENDTEL